MTESLGRIRIGTTPVVLLAVAMIVVGLVACSGGGSPTTPVVLPGGGDTAADGGSTGTGGSSGDGGTSSTTGDSLGVLEISMKDAPIDDIVELWVHITGLKIKPASGPVERVASAVLPKSYDLLDLTGGIATVLAEAEVEATTYQFIEIQLEEGPDKSYVVDSDAESHPLQIASKKIKLKGGPFEVCSEGVTSVLFDFDAEKSLKLKGNGDYLLKPFVVIDDVDVIGCDGPAGSEDDSADD
jgi:hypothetical protein